MNGISKAMAIASKDILLELRTREVVFAVLVFTILVMVIFNFAFDLKQEVTSSLAAGMLWVTFTFAGVLSFNRSFVTEKEEGCLEGMMTCPVPRESIYLGKAVSSLLFILSVEAVTLGIFTIFFNINVFTLPLVTVTILATIGFTSVGTLFSALAVNTKAREMVLPILFLPIITPVIIAAVKAFGVLLDGGSWADISSWFMILGAFDVIFLVVSYLVFEYVIEE
ncbi:heme exporter protein CcmB [Chloroflexota bacterium]